jgi:PKHD-type hydroxylase
MMLHIPEVVDRTQLDIILQALSEATFVDGRLSAGSRAKAVKSNRELQQDSEIAGHLNKVIMGNLLHHPTFRGAVLPHRVAKPYFAKYEPGMTYGDHIDDPVMGDAQRFRCDVACTVFLNQPDDYDGGELVVRTTFGDTTVKLPSGDAVVYPASSLHHVAEVTRGQRLVAVTWIQSMVRDPQQREILYELHLAREQLMRTAPQSQETARVDHAYVNLVRMWAEV